MQQVITANRLSDGIVVFLGPDNVWVQALDRAAVYSTPEEIEAGLAHAGAKANLVVEIANIDIVIEKDRIRPAKLREAIRANGPTIVPGARISEPLPNQPSQDEYTDVSI